MVKTRRNEKMFDPEYAKELLRIAKADLGSAISLSKVEKGRIENVYFLAQQALEKALKALSCHLRKPVSFTHDIEVLIEKLPADLELGFSRDLIDLTEFAAIRRYLEGYESFSPEEVKAVIDEVNKAVQWAESIILGK